jgi:hypothetical protein
MIPLNLPNNDAPVLTGQKFNKVWYLFLAGLWGGQPPQAESSVTLTGSPFIYTAARRGFLIIQGGTVSLVQFTRSTTPYSLGSTQGAFPLSQGDSITITYTGAPTVTFVPQ